MQAAFFVMFRKQILKYGEWKHPMGGKLKIDKNYVEALVRNHKYSPFAPVIRGHNEAEAEKNPSLIVSKNITDLEIDEEGLNAILDIDAKEVDKYNDVSVSVDENGQDNETGKPIGAVLRHIALTVNPYIKGLKPFVALSDPGLVINLSEIQNMAVPEAKEDETTPVVEPIDPAITPADPEEVKPEENKDEKPEDKGEPVPTPIVNASEDLQKRITELEDQLRDKNRELNLKDANDKYDTLLRAGKIVPAQKEAFLQLAQATSSVVNLSDGKEASVPVLIDALFEKAPRVIVDLAEKGKNTELSEEVGIDAQILKDIRALPAHKDKTDAEWDAYVKKNEITLKESIEKYK